MSRQEDSLSRTQPSAAATYSTFDEDSGSDSEREFTAEEAIECAGFGRYQLFVALAVGLAWMADGMEIMVVSILGPVLLCEWGISVYQEALITTVVFLGFLIGSPAFGWFADQFGRRNALFFSSVWITFYGILSAFAPTLNWLLFLRFVVGLGIGGGAQAITYFAEFLPNTSRGRSIVLAEVFFALGGTLTVTLAIFILVPHGWRWWLGVCATPSFLFAFFCLIFGYWLEWLPRSPRYDLIVGNSGNAYRTLQTVARCNGTKLPMGKLVSEPEVPRGRLLDLIRPGYRLTSGLLIILWFGSAFSYYGVVLFTTEMIAAGSTCNPSTYDSAENGTCVTLQLSDYENLLWTSAAELPGLVITAVLVDLIGRKMTLITENFVFGVTCLLLFICMQMTPMVVLLFVARAIIASSFQVLFVYTPEIYPTEVRALSLGVGSMFGRVGAMVTPYIAEVLLSLSLYFGLGIYAGIGIILSVVSFLLPFETKGRSLQPTA